MNPIEKILGKKIDVSKDSRQKLHFDEVNGKRVSFYHDWQIHLPFSLKQWQKQCELWVKRAATYQEGVNIIESQLDRIKGLGIFTEYAVQIANQAHEQLKQKFGVNNNYQLWNGSVYSYGIESQLPPTSNVNSFDVSDDRRLKRKMWW